MMMTMAMMMMKMKMKMIMMAMLMMMMMMRMRGMKLTEVAGRANPPDWVSHRRQRTPWHQRHQCAPKTVTDTPMCTKRSPVTDTN